MDQVGIRQTQLSSGLKDKAELGKNYNDGIFGVHFPAPPRYLYFKCETINDKLYVTATTEVSSLFKTFLRIIRHGGIHIVEMES